MGARDAGERSHRTPDEAARPSRPDGRRAGRQHGQGGGAPEHHAARHFQINRGTGAYASACACSTATPRASSRPSTAAPCSMAEWPCSMTCAKRVKNIEFLADPTAGEVRIGSTAFLAASFVSAVVDRLSRRYPRIVFHLVTGYVETLHRELSERNVDLLIVRRFGPIADERLDFEFLFDDSYVVAAGAQNPWVRRRRIELAELVNEAWVLPPPGSVIGSIVMEAFRASGLDYPRTTVVTDSPQVRISLLATGRFVTIFPASALRFPARRSEIKVLPVELPMARRAKRNRHPEEPRAQPRRAAFHRLRPRSRKAPGKAKMIDAMSCFGTFRSWGNVRPESAKRTKADINQGRSRYRDLMSTRLRAIASFKQVGEHGAARRVRSP